MQVTRNPYRDRKTRDWGSRFGGLVVGHGQRGDLIAFQGWTPSRNLARAR